MEYPQTTKYHFPLLTVKNTTGIILDEGVEESDAISGANAKLVLGPFGFDDAIQLEAEQVVYSSLVAQLAHDVILTYFSYVL